MNKKQLIIAWALGISLFSLTCALAEIVYPVSSQEELQSLIANFNKQKIKISCCYHNEDNSSGAEKTFEKVENVIDNGEFFIEGANGGFKLFKVDINNDWEDEYVKTLEQGAGKFFEIEAVYKEVEGRYVDIYREIKLPMLKLIRDREKDTYGLEGGYLGHAFGDIIVEKRDGKVYFTILKGRAPESWEDLHSYNVSDKPRAYEFLWENKKIQLISAYDRQLKKIDFFPGGDWNAKDEAMKQANMQESGERIPDEYEVKRAAFKAVREVLTSGKIKKGMPIEKVVKMLPYGYLESKEQGQLNYFYWFDKCPIQIILKFVNGKFVSWEEHK